MQTPALKLCLLYCKSEIGYLTFLSPIYERNIYEKNTNIVTIKILIQVKRCISKIVLLHRRLTGDWSIKPRVLIGLRVI